LSVVSGQKRELILPILDPFRPVVFALKYCRPEKRPGVETPG
jgi:hypothetical protein